MNLAIEGGREDGRYPLYTLSVSKQTVSGGGNTGGWVSGTTGTIGTTINTTIGTITGTMTESVPEETVTEDVTTDVAVEFEQTISADEIETVEVQIADLQTEIERADEGAAFEVKLKETTVIEPEVLESVRGKDIDIVLTLDNNCKWHINGCDIEDGALTTINFDVVLNTANIPEELTDSIETESGFLQFEIKYDGNFGFKAGLTLPVGTENAGKIATLFWYDTENGILVPQGKNVVNANGNTTFAFTHASDYIVVLSENADEESVAVMDDVVANAETEETVTEDTTTIENEESQNASWIIILSVILVLAAGAFVVLKKGLFKERGER